MFVGNRLITCMHGCVVDFVVQRSIRCPVVLFSCVMFLWVDRLPGCVVAVVVQRSIRCHGELVVV